MERRKWIGNPTSLGVGVSVEAIKSLLTYMVQDKDVVYAKYVQAREVYPTLAGGYYLQFRVKNEDKNAIWKIDIWILHKEDLEKNKSLMEKMTKRLQEVPSTRSLILKMKHELMKKHGRPPSSASYYLYQAILFRHLYDPEEIMAFLKESGIDIG